GAYRSNSQVSGQVIRLHLSHGLHSIIVRIAGNTLVTLLFGPSFDIRDSKDDKVNFSNLSVGDTITSSATPDPQRALVYTVFAVRDDSLLPLKRTSALLTTVAEDQSSANAVIGKSSVVISLSRSTRVVRPDGTAGSRSDLVGNQVVQVTGVLDQANKNVMDVTEIRLLTGVTAKAGLLIGHSSVKPGGTQNISISG